MVQPPPDELGTLEAGGDEDWEALEQLAHRQELAVRLEDLDDKARGIMTDADEAVRLIQVEDDGISAARAARCMTAVSSCMTHAVPIASCLQSHLTTRVLNPGAGGHRRRRQGDSQHDQAARRAPLCAPP